MWVSGLSWLYPLYSIDPSTGSATEIDLGGANVLWGDGIVLRGRTLHVVQNFLNKVAVVRLNPKLTSGELTDVVASSAFRVPSSVALFGGRVYVVNSRFDAALPPIFGGSPLSIDYDVVKVPT